MTRPRSDGCNPAGRSRSAASAAPALANGAWTRSLDVNGIEVIYNHVILVLKGVSLQVPEGRIVALMGGNGAGKTTTLRAVSNLLEGERGAVTKGSIELRGERIEKLSTAAMVERGVVQVMEGRRCFAHLTIEENLLDRRLHAPRRRGGDRRDARQGLQLLPAPEGTPRRRRRHTPRAASSRCARSAAR